MSCLVNPRVPKLSVILLVGQTVAHGGQTLTVFCVPALNQYNQKLERI